MPQIDNTDNRILAAINEVQKSAGVAISVASKGKALLKFGRNKVVGTSGATLQEFLAGETDETYLSDNLITHYASSNAGDTVSGVIEGHTISSGLLSFVTQTFTVAGQTKTALATPLARATRAYITGATNLAGILYFSTDVSYTAGVPASNAHLIVDGVDSHNQSEKCSTSLSATDYWLVTSIYGNVLKKTAAYADIELQSRTIGNVFRTRTTFGASNVAGGRIEFDPLLILPANSDVRLRAIADGANTDVSGGIEGHLAAVIG